MSIELIEALAEHVNVEEMAGRTYRQLSYWADREAWDGTQEWMLGEADDEYSHAQEFADYVAMRGGPVVLLQFQKEFAQMDLPATLPEAYKQALELEQSVMDSLIQLSLQADEDDPDVVRFLQKYLEIGTKSIYDLQTWVTQLDRIKGDAGALWMWDRARLKAN